jgi:hypothetical protein
MIHDVPMLTDFGARLALGLAALLLLTSRRSVPLPFFRTQCQVILGALVVAAVDASRPAGSSAAVWILIADSVLAYVASVSWGLGLPRIAIPVTCLIVLATGIWLADASRADSPALWIFNTASRYSSGFLLGAVR